jgi:hypothetical protein
MLVSRNYMDMGVEYGLPCHFAAVEYSDAFDLVRQVKALLQTKYEPQGFNVGVRARTMPDSVRCFNELGIGEFLRWLPSGAVGSIPAGLLNDADFSVPLQRAPIPEIPHFHDSYEFGVFLVELLNTYDPHQISYNTGLWSWLAALFFDQLAPVDDDGKRSLRRPYLYVLSDNRLYYRHLVRSPWYLVRTHGAEARFLLTPIRASAPFAVWAAGLLLWAAFS